MMRELGVMRGHVPGTLLMVVGLLTSSLVSGAGNDVALAANHSPTLRGFPISVYPPPVKVAKGVVTGMADGCPNPTGLTVEPGPSGPQVHQLLVGINSGNIRRMRRATDRTLWSSLRPHKPIRIYQTHLSAAQPARNAPYAALIRNGCGQTTLARTKWVESCPSACATSSPALIIHLFLINRQHHWLVWGIYQ